MNEPVSSSRKPETTYMGAKINGVKGAAVRRFNLRQNTTKTRLTANSG